MKIALPETQCFWHVLEVFEQGKHVLAYVDIFLFIILSMHQTFFGLTTRREDANRIQVQGKVKDIRARGNSPIWWTKPALNGPMDKKNGKIREECCIATPDVTTMTAMPKVNNR